MSRRLLLFILAISGVMAGLAWTPLLAQQPGRIDGTAADTVHQVLPGAAVRLLPGNRSISTNASGHFSFLSVAPGDYTIRISYVGFKPKDVPVTVLPGGTVQISPVLELASSNQTVVVTAPRPYGEAEAINTERTSLNIVDAMPESVITSLPNANVADATGRLPGVTLERDEGEGKYLQIRGTEPRLSNVTVDGVELESPEAGIRQVKLDVIPADLVGDIQLNKTLEPDQSGDAIGGSVNLVTKTAGSRPTVTLYTNGGMAPIDNNRYAGEVGGTLGRRFGSHQQLGAIVSGSYDYNGRGIDDFEPVPDALSTVSTPLFDNADMRQYLYTRHRKGFGGSLDYTISQNSSLYLRGLYADFVDGGTRTVYNVDAQGNGPSAGAEQRIGDYLISSLILGGAQSMPGSNMTVDWQVSGARSRMLYPQFDNTGSFDYVGPASQCTFDSSATTNPYLPQFAPVCYQEANNPANFQFSKFKFGNHGETSKLDWAGTVDVTKSFLSGANPSTVQFGVNYNDSRQFDNSYKVVYTPALDPNTGQPYALPLARFIDTSYSNPHYYGGAYPAGPFIGFSTLRNYVLQNPSQFTMSSTQGHDSNNFWLTEKIPAAYIMDTTEFGRVRLSGGLRLEATRVSTLSPDNTNSLTVAGAASYYDLMPSLAVQYRLDSNSDFRAVYGRGISRPVPADMTSAVSTDTSVTPNRASLGNPGLKPEHGNDFDLLYERYLTPLGAVRVGWFYKSLSDPIVSLQTNPTTGPYAGYRVTQPANGGSAHIQGVEFSFEQQFTYLPGALRGLGLSGNYSYTTSKAINVDPGNRTDMPAMLRQAPNTWNLSPTFDLGGFSARIGLAYNGANIYQYNYADGAPGGITGPSGDVYEYTHFQIDAQAGIAIWNGWQATFSGLNLNNAVFGFYQGSPQFPIQREFYKPTYTIGLRWTMPE